MIKFLNCKIDKSFKVLEPRLETEFWTKKAIAMMQKIPRPLKVLDIFSGSGCIGIAILKNTRSFVDFSDISKDSLKQIKKNVKLNNIVNQRFTIIHSNIFSKISSRYDFILANPPYVALDRIGEVDPQVLKKDPHLALFAGEDGMLFIEKLLKDVKKHLNPNGILFLEFDPMQKEKIKMILEKKKLEYEFKKDQFKKTRFLIAKNVS
jgi:release factor glutamine methyltransferase